MPEATRPVASVIIPAHNEAGVLGRCLEPLLTVQRSSPLEVIVAANGCTDSTAEIASQTDGVVLVEVTRASKIGALNAADDVATAYPRIYLDADVHLDEDAVESLVTTLRTDAPRLAAPAVHYDTSGADAVVVAFYRIYTQLPSSTGTTVGRGVYGLSRAGRERFDTFPDIHGDDLFVNRLFAPDETSVTAGVSTVRTPRHWRDLIRVRRRIATGNAQLARARTGAVGALAHGHDFSRTTGRTASALTTLIRRDPRQLPDALVFAAVALLARLRTKQDGGWHRDPSTR